MEWYQQVQFVAAAGGASTGGRGWTRRRAAGPRRPTRLVIEVPELDLYALVLIGEASR